MTNIEAGCYGFGHGCFGENHESCVLFVLDSWKNHDAMKKEKLFPETGRFERNMYEKNKLCLEHRPFE